MCPVLRLTALGDDMRNELTFISLMNTAHTHIYIHTQMLVDGPQRSIEQRDARGS